MNGVPAAGTIVLRSVKLLQHSVISEATAYIGRSWLMRVALMAWICCADFAAAGVAEPWLSPNCLVATKDGRWLYVACKTGKKVLLVDTSNKGVAGAIELPGEPEGMVLSADERQLWVCCGVAPGVIAVIDIERRQVSKTVQAGHSPWAIVPSPKGQNTAFVCDRFRNEVRLLDIASGKILNVSPVQREPVAAVLTPDGKFLLVANLLHSGVANSTNVAAVVSVLNAETGAAVKELRLPVGSGSLNAISLSPDGRYAVVTHIVSRFYLPTTQLDRGWVNTNAKTIIDTQRMEVVNTVLLDDVDRGAANPWGAGWSADGKWLVVAHAGAHEISIIDFPALMAKLAALPKSLAADAPTDYTRTPGVQADVPSDLAFLAGLRRRVPLPQAELGPRSVCVIGSTVWVANYFSDSVASLDLLRTNATWQLLRLQPPQPLSAKRKGEMYFHDARICFQGWQSCASCHPGDGRVDALNWDLLNDGIGNPKNNKSLLLAHSTPPAMSRGVRETGEEAVRAGIQHILLTVQPPEVGESLDAYLKSLKPVPSPSLSNPELAGAISRGKKLFESSKVGCAECHPPGLHTDLKSYDVGTVGQFDKPEDAFDTPTLVEVWRTAPYLHDGSAATILELLGPRNREDKHGRTSALSPAQLRDLAEYVLSL